MQENRKTHRALTFSLDLSTVPHGLWIAIGEAAAKCQQLCHTPLLPDVSAEMHQVVLNKITAQHLPPLYPARATQNIITATNLILDAIETEGVRPICVDDLVTYTAWCLEVAPHDPQAVPGQMRQHQVTVHEYKPPSAQDCAVLVQKLCDWLNDGAFCTPKLDGISLGLIKAIISHLYLALIHPFGDGNGRTARLLEFRLLMEAGAPSCAGHLLANSYNRDRVAYYNQLGDVVRTGSVARFIAYAVTGFVGELDIQLECVERQHRSAIWLEHAHQVLGDMMCRASRRQLSLALALNQRDAWVDLGALSTLTTSLSKAYNEARRDAVKNDVKHLVDLGLLDSAADVVRANRNHVLAFLPRGRRGQFESVLEKSTSQI